MTAPKVLMSRVHRAPRRGYPLAAMLAVIVSLLVMPVAAQDSQLQALIDRIDRLQGEFNTMQRAVYRGEEIPAPAAPLPSDDLTPTQAARIELRLSQFEAELRALTGQLEEMGFSMDRVAGRLDRLVADVDQRLQRLESGQPVAGGQVVDQNSGQQVAAAQDSGQPNFDSGPKTLGTISQGDLEAFQSQSVEQASPSAETVQTAAAGGYRLPGDTPSEQYKHAFGLLRQANYSEAELALGAFVEQYPTDPLAGNAKYWLGETYYVRGDYQQAAVTFAEAYQQYPDNSKAPDNLLKLGMSLSSLGSTADACGTHAELLKRYPNAATTVVQRATQERQRLACP